MSIIITEETAESRLNSPNNLANRFNQDNLFVIPTQKTGYHYKRVPDFIKVIAGTLSISGADTQKNIGKEFGMSQTEVSYIENRKPQVCNKEVNEKLDRTVAEVRDLAMEKLLNSLGCITSDKLANAKLQTVASVASSMARVVKDTSPDTRDDNRVQILIYSPPQKSEDCYNAIDV